MTEQKIKSFAEVRAEYEEQERAKREKMEALAEEVKQEQEERRSRRDAEAQELNDGLGTKKRRGRKPKEITPEEQEQRTFEQHEREEEKRLREEERAAKREEKAAKKAAKLAAKEQADMLKGKIRALRPLKGKIRALRPFRGKSSEDLNGIGLGEVQNVTNPEKTTKFIYALSPVIGACALVDDDVTLKDVARLVVTNTREADLLRNLFPLPPTEELEPINLDISEAKIIMSDDGNAYIVQFPGSPTREVYRIALNNFETWVEAGKPIIECYHWIGHHMLFRQMSCGGFAYTSLYLNKEERNAMMAEEAARRAALEATATIILGAEIAAIADEDPPVATSNEDGVLTLADDGENHENV